MPEKLYLSNKIDCEATQPAIGDAELGRRGAMGFADVLEAHDCRGSFYCIPSEAQSNGDVYRQLRARGHEIGLHVHPADLGYQEFLGVYGPDEQRDILRRSMDAYAQALGETPVGICLGYGSCNDHTAMVLYELGFRHGAMQVPGRILPECASVAAGAPLDAHYKHRWNRVLTGDLDFVELPNTVDPNSRMWGGKHCQDLRIELVDAKNHFYTIRQAIERQVRAGTPVKLLVAVTHNTYEYSDPADFRRQTLEGVLAHARRLAQEHDLELVGLPEAEIAAAYRAAVPLPTEAVSLTLDRRGHDK